MSLSMPTRFPLHVLLTRPAAQSARFEAQIVERFGDVAEVVNSPLTEIAFLSVDVKFDDFDAVVFTSQNGVRAYQAMDAAADIPAYCVGTRTAELASDAGLGAVAASGNVASLNDLLRTAAPEARLLHLSGKHVADEVQGDVTRIIAYDQIRLDLSAAARSVLTQPIDVLVPLFSPNAARWFEGALGPECKAKLYVVCISKTVAETLDLSRYENISFISVANMEGMMDKMSDFFPAAPA